MNESELRAQIKDSIKQNGPYTRNLIRACVLEHHRQFGLEKTNKLIDDFNLGKWGFNKEVATQLH